MRGLKAKTMRRVARETGIVPLAYLAKTHIRAVENPEYPAKLGAPQFLQIERLQIILGRCQRNMVQRMKKVCPKDSFFGMPVRQFRGMGKAGTIQAFDTREEALAAAGQL